MGKWQTDWNVSGSLRDMNLLMWRTGLVPYSSESPWIILRPCARRHICFTSKSQAEHKMSREYKYLSCLHQVFISPPLCFSLPGTVFLLHGTAPSLLSPTVSHKPLLFSAAIVLSLLLFRFNQPIRHSPYLLFNCPYYHPRQHGETAFIKRYQSVRQTDRRLASCQREGKVEVKETESH